MGPKLNLIDQLSFSSERVRIECAGFLDWWKSSLGIAIKWPRT